MLIDLDPQGNATVGCGVMKSEFSAGTYDVLLGDADINDAIIKTQTGIDLLAANDDLAGAQIELLELPDREVRLKRALLACDDDYDYIFIDCPPSLNILTINAMTAAKSILIPIQCEYYALEGVSALISTIDKIKYSLNPGLKIEGLLRTMYDGRNSLTLEVSEQLVTHFLGKVYNTVIPRNVRVAEAPGYGVSVIDYDKTSKGATAYLNLAGEFLMKQHLVDDDDNMDDDDENYTTHRLGPDATQANEIRQPEEIQTLETQLMNRHADDKPVVSSENAQAGSVNQTPSNRPPDAQTESNANHSRRELANPSKEEKQQPGVDSNQEESQQQDDNQPTTSSS